jgi:hypothetical protein
MRQAVTGWIVVAGCLMLLGIGTVLETRSFSKDEYSAGTIEQWRQYATEVQQGTRKPSAINLRLLTEAAIAQNEYASSATQLLRLVGAGIAILGFLLAIDLVRYRVRHTAPPERKGD